MSHTTNASKTYSAHTASLDTVFGRTQSFLALAHKGNDYEKELHYARCIGDLKGTEARLVSAQAIVDVAVRHGQDIGDEKYAIFSEAMVSSQKSKNLDNLGLFALMADRLHTQLPLLTSLSEGVTPSQQDLETAHTKHIVSIKDIFNVWNKVKFTHSYNESIAKGFLSETAASLLLERWALLNNVNRWIPSFTTLSEDHGNVINGGSKMGWDISIYTDDATNPNHKLQVKTKHSDSEEVKYQNTGIDFIPVSMLWVHKADETVKPQHILIELQQEYNYSNYRETNMLNQRTDVLLDMFS
jgi:hypothetical protein